MLVKSVNKAGTQAGPGLTPPQRTAHSWLAHWALGSPLLPGFLRSQSMMAARISSGLADGSGVAAEEAEAEPLPWEAGPAGASGGGGGGAGSRGGTAGGGALGLADKPGTRRSRVGTAYQSQARACRCRCRVQANASKRRSLVRHRRRQRTWRKGRSRLLQGWRPAFKRWWPAGRRWRCRSQCRRPLGGAGRRGVAHGGSPDPWMVPVMLSEPIYVYINCWAAPRQLICLPCDGKSAREPEQGTHMYVYTS